MHLRLFYATEIYLYTYLRLAVHEFPDSVFCVLPMPQVLGLLTPERREIVERRPVNVWQHWLSSCSDYKKSYLF